MSSNSSQQFRITGYGVGSPKIGLAPPAIIADRAPTTNDYRFPIGQAWVYQISATNDRIYFLGDVQADIATWILSGPPTPGSSVIIQIVTASTTSVVDCSTIIPFDDTIPQITEGDQVLTCSITPTSLTSRLLIQFFGFSNSEGANNGTMALFQNPGNNALNAVSLNVDGPRDGTISLSYNMVAGTVSPTTFQVRAGPDVGAADIYINGDSTGTRLYGGAASASLTVTEYTP